MHRTADHPHDPERDLLEELRTSEARFRAICEAAPLGIYVSEVPAGVVYVNPAMERALGRSQEELKGVGWKRYLHPDDAAVALSDRSQQYARSASMDVEARYVRSDGRVIWTRLCAAPIIQDGELTGYVGVLEDMTERKALQAQLVTAGRLASVGTLAAGVAHEVNTPLAVATANLEWTQQQVRRLIERLEQSEAPAASTLQSLRALVTPLEHAHDAALRVGLIVKDLGLFSRPEASDDGTADLERVLHSAMRMASHELRHRARLVHDYADLPWVSGNEARLAQVFLNLLINAAHAIPEGSADEHEVRVKASLCAPGMVAVEVRDTGCGIPPQVMGNIFNPFFTTKDSQQGTGLGLAICHRIVSAVGGRIEVESEVGKGTAFRVLLQTATEPPPATAEHVPAARADVKRSRVLLIDDDQMVLDSIALALSDRSDVVKTTRAREALERLAAGERFDAILCDLMMPDMNGMQFHERLAHDLPDLAAQVTFLTGGAVTASARDFLERTPNRRLDKPFTLDQLYALLPPAQS